MVTTEKSGRWLDAGLLALLSLVLTPLTIVIHELGHFIVPLVSGLPAQLHPSHVSGGAELGRQAAGLVALQAGGGPFMTFLMGVIGALLYGRESRRLWALAFTAAAVSRLFVAVAWLGLRILLVALRKPYGGHPNFDEHLVAEALGLPPEVTALTATLVLAGVLYWVLRHTPRGRRILYVGMMLIGVVTGMLLWPMLAPEVLFVV